MVLAVFNIFEYPLAVRRFFANILFINFSSSSPSLQNLFISPVLICELYFIFIPLNRLSWASLARITACFMLSESGTLPLSLLHLICSYPISSVLIHISNLSHSGILIFPIYLLISCSEQLHLLLSG